MTMAATSDSGPKSPLPDDADSNGNKRKGRKRLRSFTAEERSIHSAVEKQRREALNANFIDLARLVPGLARVHRLSKSLIVSEAAKHLQAQREMCLAAACEVQAILAENLQLVAEVNSWQVIYGGGPGARQASPVGEALEALLKTDQQVFGAFPAGFGDNGIGEGPDSHEEVNQDPARAERSMAEPVQVDTISPRSNDEANSHTILNAQKAATAVPNSSQPLQLSTAMTGVTNTFSDYLGADQLPLQPLSLNEEVFCSLDDAYNASLASHADLYHASFADMNLPQELYPDFSPENGYILRPEDSVSCLEYNIDTG